MHRSSESVAALAAALAKAQLELVNPVKSLVGTITLDERSGGMRAFRYAPLSSGLETVRATLGKHAIAIVQTTAIDAAAGTINLTTVLAHASGEWISSDWPVCRLNDLSTPHRMGAALTYARRYSLFSVVGIAGEDDLDASDLNPGSIAPMQPDAALQAMAATDDRALGQKSSLPKDGGKASVKLKASRDGGRLMLDASASALARDRMLDDISLLDGLDSAAEWARSALQGKNALTAEDANKVEEAFTAGLSRINVNSTAGKPRKNTKQGDPSLRPASSAAVIDKSKLPMLEPRRYRDKLHLKFVASQPCLVCGRQPSDSHHIRFAQQRALARKASDEFTVPLCRLHHRELHRTGDEPRWWRDRGIEPLDVAERLWGQSRGHAEAESTPGE